MPTRYVIGALVIAALLISAGLLAPRAPVRERVMATLKPAAARIDGVELYGVRVNAERRWSHKVQRSRAHLFIRFTGGGKSGWAEMNLRQVPPGAKALETHIARVRWFGELKGKTPAEAIAFLTAHQETLDRAGLEAAEMAVLDLGGRLTGKPAAEILGLAATNPIPGLFCILSDDPQKVREEARRSLEQNLRTHVKVHLYGKSDVDVAVVKAVREVMGPHAYVGGDVNRGYRPKASDASVDDIVTALTALRDAGLSACEDPAAMSNEQWSEVQRRVGSLDLLPDYPMQPAWKGRLTMNPSMGRIFNIHPHGMGSLIEAVELGRVIQRHGKKLMVGDASLVGPACSAWQQVAIGLGADWVEALEKPQESDVFQQCVQTNPIRRTADGRFFVGEHLPGFGVEIDIERLKALSVVAISLGSEHVEQKKSP
jgi:L-alanine-DL-glutamate epimerase-like enolase superfamily enzyme